MRGLRAAQSSTNSSDEFSPAEWLNDVIIRAKVQTSDTIPFLAKCADHNHRNLAPLADGSTDIETAFIRQHDIQNNKVYEALGHDPLQVSGACHSRGIKPGFPQQTRNEDTDAGVIIQHDHMRNLSQGLAVLSSCGAIGVL